jgi:hypothetical protein
VDTPMFFGGTRVVGAAHLVIEDAAVLCFTGYGVYQPFHED